MSKVSVSATFLVDDQPAADKLAQALQDQGATTVQTDPVADNASNEAGVQDNNESGQAAA